MILNRLRRIFTNDGWLYFSMGFLSVMGGFKLYDRLKVDLNDSISAMIALSMMTIMYFIIILLDNHSPCLQKKYPLRIKILAIIAMLVSRIILLFISVVIQEFFLVEIDDVMRSVAYAIFAVVAAIWCNTPHLKKIFSFILSFLLIIYAINNLAYFGATLLTETAPGIAVEKAQLLDIWVAKDDHKTPTLFANTQKGEIEYFIVGPDGLAVGVLSGASLGGGYMFATYEIITDIDNPEDCYVQRIVKKPNRVIRYLYPDVHVNHWIIHIDKGNLENYLIKQQGLKKTKKTILNSLALPSKREGRSIRLLFSNLIQFIKNELHN